MALISVIVPVYNVELYLKRCVDSILAQTFSDFDLVLIDDGSPDRCGEICDRYVEKDKRIHVIHQENGGLSAARNAGIDWAFEHSDSEWITFIDSDDWVHPEYLSILLNAVVKNNLNIALCSHLNVTDEEEIIVYNKYGVELIEPEELFIHSITDATIACAKIYNKKKFEFIRYPNGRLHEDVFTTHLVLFEEQMIGFIDFPLYYYFYTNPKSITNSQSIKRLKDAMDGQRLRVQYFKENNFEKAYNYELNSIVYNSIELRAIEQGIVHKDVKYERSLRKRIRKKLHHDKLKLSSHIWVYELAYPVCMKYYWIVKAILRRVCLGIQKK